MTDPRPASAPEAPLRAVLAGVGRGAWARAMAAAGVELVAACDPDPEAAAAVLAACGVEVPVAEDVAPALALRPDLVIDATRPGARGGIARQALRAGAHVLMTPPLARDPEEAAEILGAAGRARGRLFLDLRHRLAAQVQALRRAQVPGAPCAVRLPPGSGPRHWIDGPGAMACDLLLHLAGRPALSVTADAGGLIFTTDGAPLRLGPEGAALPALPGPEAALADVAAALRGERAAVLPGPREAAAALAMALAAAAALRHPGHEVPVAPLGLTAGAEADARWR